MKPASGFASLRRATDAEITVSNELKQPHLPDTLPAEPMRWAEGWLAWATDDEVQPNPNAMTLITVDDDGQPSGRIVLCKQFVADPGYIVFYTNYQSRKATELFAHPDVAVVFHWDAIGRQVRMEGTAIRSPDSESDAYFRSRPAGSRLGAWSSDQSRPLGSRDALRAQLETRAAELGVELDADGAPAGEPDLPRPPHWGGIRIWPRRVELWVDGESRIHDRAVWERSLSSDGNGSFQCGPWSATRLQP